jgi:hypothetical protein
VRISQFARDYGRAHATEMMEDEVEITRPGPAETSYDPNTRVVTTNSGVLIYDGPARIWEVRAGTKQTIGDRVFWSTQTYVSILWNAAIPEPEDRIKIAGSVDAQLTGRTMRVQAVTRGGGLRVSRVMAVEFYDFTEEDL